MFKILGRLPRVSPATVLFPAIIAASLGLTACGSSASSGHRSLRLAIVGPLNTLDPARASNPAQQFAASLLFTGLMKFSTDMHVIPELAVSLPTISSDGRTYTFTIRQDARFSDGHRLTAQDVASSFARALSPALDSRLARRYLGEIAGARRLEAGAASTLTGVRVLDPLTLQIRLSHPDATFLQKLAFPVAATVERGNPSVQRAGAGPWILSARDRTGALVFAPRRHFYGGPLELRSLTLVPTRDDGEAVSLYKKGRVDVARVPFDQWPALQARDDFHSNPALEAYYAVATSGAGHAPAVDRSALAVLSPAFSALDGLVPPAVPDYESTPPTSDPLGGNDSGAPAVRLVTTSSDPGLLALRRALGKQWRISSRGTPMRLVHVWRQLPDPVTWLSAALPYTRSSWFRSELRNAVQLTNDPVGRMNAYSTAENWIVSTDEVVPLVSASLGYLIRPTVQNLQVTPTGIMPSNNNWASTSVT